MHYHVFVFAAAIAFASCHSSVSSAQDAQASPSTPPVLLQMIRDDSVHQDLRMTDDQIAEVVDALKTVDGRWFRARNFPLDKQPGELDELTGELRSQLKSILDSPQLIRLAELERQALGTRMLIRADVAKGLGLSKGQQQRFIDAFLETDKKSAELQSQVRKGELAQDEAQKEIGKLQAAERKLFADRLSVEQRVKLGPLTGRPFDFSKVKRTYPLAPELMDDGAQWVQGGPQKLESLKGKVVAVHYYAYQCINCKRNLPHYNAWHKDYADQGLVIVGIQTPETSRERKFDLVKAAATESGIEYPVVLDSKSTNWKNWSNTMWPTVYLIDKKGFIRRWWQGELNWQGNPGEKDMRRSIEQLLAE